MTVKEKLERNGNVMKTSCFAEQTWIFFFEQTYFSMTWYSHATILVSSGVPFLALTGTANDKMQETIVKELAMKKDTVVLNISPERTNIRFTVVKTKREDHLLHLQWLVDLIKAHKDKVPKCIIFCSTIQDVAKVTGHLLDALGDHAYVPDKPRVPAYQLLGIYHSMTCPKYKSRFADLFKNDSGCVRVVVATSALSMGVNFPDVKYVIHFGPARTTVDHIQEAGRAGRNGEPAHNVIIYHGNQLSHCDKAVKTFCKADSCVRKALFADYAHVESVQPPHDCCSNCAKRCLCAGEECQRDTFPFDQPVGSLEKETMVACQRTISKEDQVVLREALNELQGQLNSQSLTVFGSSSAHGFSAELIDAIIAEAASIFSISDILTRFPVFSVGHAKLILEIFQETFEDIVTFADVMEVMNEELFSLLSIGSEDYPMEDTSDEDSDPDGINSAELENL